MSNEESATFRRIFFRLGGSGNLVREIREIREVKEVNSLNSLNSLNALTSLNFLNSLNSLKHHHPAPEFPILKKLILVSESENF